MSKNGERWAFLEAWNPNQLNIERNPHNMNYETVESWLADTVDNDNPWCDVLDGEREKIIATKSIWTLQIYPRTPIGFYAMCASSLEALIDWAMKNDEIREERGRAGCKECVHAPSGKCPEHKT